MAAAAAAAVAVAAAPPQRQFLTSVNITSLNQLELNALTGTGVPSALEGVKHYRLVPYAFPKGMRYHFDGLAAVLRFEFIDGRVTLAAAPYASKLQQDYSRCIFYGSGTGPTPGLTPCLRNPVVNLLPINEQMWLTIDTAEWGRIDPTTLATVDAKAQVKTLVLNAHPACDRTTRECFVQHPCPKNDPMVPVTDQACVSRLRTTPTNLEADEIGRATMPKSKWIQHSHSPCVTPRFVVAKLDSFGKYFDHDTTDRGLLRQMHQLETNDWLLMDRQTNKTSVLTSNFTFVNNHFWNCFEEPETGVVVVDTVAATEDYLHTYFNDSLQQPTNWSRMFKSPMRCRLDPAASISCTPLLPESPNLFFDYPTFNPLWKMNPAYRYFYAISPTSPGSQWFDRIIKVDVHNRVVEKTWHAPGVFVTEADFVPASSLSAAEDEDRGYLLSVLFNSSSSASSFAIFDASDLSLLEMYDLGSEVVPFHAHGVSCIADGSCFTNP